MESKQPSRCDTKPRIKVLRLSLGVMTVALLIGMWIGADNNKQDERRALVGRRLEAAPSRDLQTGISDPPSDVPSAAPSTGGPSTSPSDQPSASPSVASRYRQAVLEVTSVNVLSDATSPQRKALDWLENVDDIGYSNPRQVQQRYALVVLDFGFHPANDSPSFAQAGVDECRWFGTHCNPNTSNLFDAVDKILWPKKGLRGRIEPEIGILSWLTELDVSQNRIGGRLPDGLYRLQRLQELVLYSNQIGGPISESISGLYRLTHFLAGDNKLTGSIPKGLGSNGGSGLRPLRYLSLYKNQLSGTLPGNMRWRNLFQLDLGYNQFTGGIPVDWLESLFQLRNLYLDHNSLRGALHSDLASIGNNRLQQLVINDNNFGGDFPDGWGKRSLQTLHAQNNRFDHLDKGVCNNIVFWYGELTSMRFDCDICTCGRFCVDCY